VLLLGAASITQFRHNRRHRRQEGMTAAPSEAEKLSSTLCHVPQYYPLGQKFIRSWLVLTPIGSSTNVAITRIDPARAYSVPRGGELHLNFRSAASNNRIR
jgi:hypothetical protein